MAANIKNLPSAGPKVQDLFPDVIFTAIPKPEQHPVYNYQGFKPGVETLEVGHKKTPEHRAFGVKTTLQRDEAITVRDGKRLYADIFRPSSSDSDPVPAILPWSPYGKTGTGPQNYDRMAPFRAAIPMNRTSGYEKFEAPDPAEWAERGYSIVNIDARGAGNSEGTIAQWGAQEAEDIYDVISWLAEQPWCNGSVCMAGNSWLAISQINFASRMRHPALKAIAPWECYNDAYRHIAARGGRPHIPGFQKMIAGGFAGPEGAENMVAMLQKRPLYDDYWETKRIPVENIDGVPVYMTASYSSMLHTYGSFEVFRSAKSPLKWLRIHPYQEWYDIYRDDMNDELQRYFDRYAKNIDNGWEKSTPIFRLSLLGFDGSKAQTVVERVEKICTLQRQQFRTFFLDIPSKGLQIEAPKAEANTSYEGHHLTDSLDFTVFFKEATELAGYSKATLFMACPDHDDFDVVVQIRKIDATGTPLVHLNYPCPVPAAEVPDLNVAKTLGPQGFLRASHRVSLDREKSHSETDLFYSHRVREAIKPGTIVKLEIPLWPIGMVFAKGEGIMLRVSGHDMCLPETELCRLREPEDANVGRHVLYAGPDHPSSLTIPFIKG